MMGLAVHGGLRRNFSSSLQEMHVVQGFFETLPLTDCVTIRMPEPLCHWTR